MRHLETLHGVGMVARETGEQVGLRRYHLSVLQSEIDVSSLTGRGTVPGMRRTEGTIELEGMEAYRLVGESLVLTLEDGRRFPFFVQNSSGRIAARGGISAA